MSSLNNEEEEKRKANISFRMSHSSVWNDGETCVSKKLNEWLISRKKKNISGFLGDGKMEERITLVKNVWN